MLSCGAVAAFVFAIVVAAESAVDENVLVPLLPSHGHAHGHASSALQNLLKRNPTIRLMKKQVDSAEASSEADDDDYVYVLDDVVAVGKRGGSAMVRLLKKRLAQDASSQRLVRLVRGGAGSTGGQMVRLLKREAGNGLDSAPDRAAASRYMNMRTL